MAKGNNMTEEISVTVDKKRYSRGKREEPLELIRKAGIDLPPSAIIRS